MNVAVYAKALNCLYVGVLLASSFCRGLRLQARLPAPARAKKVWPGPPSNELPVCGDLLRARGYEKVNEGDLHLLDVVITVLSSPKTPETDRSVATAFSQYNPLTAGESADADFERLLLYVCVLDKATKDSVLGRVYRYGLLQSAAVLRAKGLYSRGQYLYARDSHSQNLMHLSVRAKEPQLVANLGDFLGLNVMWLLVDKPFARNDRGQLPIHVAFEEMHVGCQTALQDLYRMYETSLSDDRFLKKGPRRPRNWAAVLHGTLMQLVGADHEQAVLSPS